MEYSYESVFRYLKSGMSNLIDEDADYLENYVLYAGVRGYSMWKKPFYRRLKNKDEAAIKALLLCRRNSWKKRKTSVQSCGIKRLV